MKREIKMDKDCSFVPDKADVSGLMTKRILTTKEGFTRKI